MKSIEIVLLTALCFNAIEAYPQYAAKIPNGYSVPNPDPQGGVWAGVGHTHAGGGGDRNVFGLDFASNNHVWTKELCEADSDEDGRSNGEELGDPDCVWKEGDEPSGPALSHPGIVDEPMDAFSVRDCSDYVAPEDEIIMDVTFTNPTEIDETQTHYICEQKVVDVPTKEVLHKIKHSVLLDNSDILHHMFVYICPAGTTSTPDGDRVGEGPYECSGNESGCVAIGSWAVGPIESCNPPNVGTEVDFSESDQIVVKIEAHYDNTLGVPQQDQSGIRFHLTPTLLPLKGATILTGMTAVDTNFEIPPQKEQYPLSNICPTAITENMDHAVYAYEFSPHMHLYGRSLVTEHYRCGKKIGEIGRINAYEFDNQQTYALDPPIKILPGDAFVTTCSYDNPESESIFGGEETTDEMCLNFINTYPPAATESAPNLLSACFAFENGAKINGQTMSFRAALGDRDQTTIASDFVSDPEANIGNCCANDSCEEMYLSEIDGACGSDVDCTGDLICSGGLCSPSSQNPVLEDDSGEDPADANSNAETPSEEDVKDESSSLEGTENEPLPEIDSFDQASSDENSAFKKFPVKKVVVVSILYTVLFHHF